MNPKRNFAARIGGWSARHWKTAAFGWIAFVILAFQLGGAIGTKTLEQSESGVGESGHADKVYAESYPQEQGQMVLISGRDASTGTDSPEFRATVADVRSEVAKVEGVENVQDPYARGNREHLISDTTNAVMVPFEHPGQGRRHEGRGHLEGRGGRRRGRRARRTPSCASSRSAAPLPRMRSTRSSRTTSARRRRRPCRSR